MSAAETALAWIAGIGAAATALAAIWVAGKHLWRAFGWKGAFWAWAHRFVKTVDVITDLPEKLEEIQSKDTEKLAAIDTVKQELLAADKVKLAAIAEVKQTLDAHIAETATGRQEWAEMREQLIHLVETTEDVHYEVKNNGGGSMKDQSDRIERGVQGLYATPGEQGIPGRSGTRPTTTPRRSRRPKEAS